MVTKPEVKKTETGDGGGDGTKKKNKPYFSHTKYSGTVGFC